jgi:lipopolysaccharide export system permease protein
MLILDRYLLRQFLQIFAYCFISLAGLYIVIDAFNKLDKFNKVAADHGNLFLIMAQWYGYQCIGFFDRTSGMLTLIAAMFTVALFQRYNELIALQAAGVRKGRIIRPIVIAVAAIVILAAVNRELVMPLPQVREHLASDVQDLGGQNARDLNGRTDRQTDIVISGKHWFAKDKRIEKPAFSLPQNLDEYGRQLIAADAYYRPADENHPAGYLLTGISQPKNFDTKPSLRLHDEPVIFTPHDFSWLKATECFVASDISFELLTSGADWWRYASLAELIKGLRNPSLDSGADKRVAIHARIVQPVLDLLLLFLGLPLVLSRYNRNVFFAIGLCVIVVVGFYMIVLGSQYLGSNYLFGVSPALAAWLPLLVFLPLAAWLGEPLLE